MIKRKTFYGLKLKYQSFRFSFKIEEWQVYQYYIGTQSRGL